MIVSICFCINYLILHKLFFLLLILFNNISIHFFLSFFFFWTNSIPHVCNDMLNVSLVLIFEITGVWIFFVEGFTLWCYSILHLWADSNRLYACGKFSSSIFMCFRDTFVLVFFFAWHKFPFLFSFYIFEPENTLGFLPIHWNWKVK